MLRNRWISAGLAPQLLCLVVAAFWLTNCFGCAAENQGIADSRLPVQLVRTSPPPIESQNQEVVPLPPVSHEELPTVRPCSLQAAVESKADQRTTARSATLVGGAPKLEISPLPPAFGGSARVQMPINLPLALRLANSNNPTIALASARVQEAYLRVDQVNAAWLPDLRTGPLYQRHDGRIQATDGTISSVSKSSLFEHGDIIASWNTSDLLYSPLLARQFAAAQNASASAVRDRIQLEAAITYEDLLRVAGLLRINSEGLQITREMLKNTESAESAGVGKTPADAPQARTELNKRLVERSDLQTQLGELSARLASLLMLDPTLDLYPLDPQVVPLQLVSDQLSLDELVSIGISRRPEMSEARAIADGSRTRLRQAEIAPLLPRLEVAYTSGTFGGGPNDQFNDFGTRGDGTAEAVWELRNFGAGDVIQRRIQRVVVNQAEINLSIVRSRVGEDVAAAAKSARSRLESFRAAQTAVHEALITWQRLRDSSFGIAGADRRYEPLTPLIAGRDLQDAWARYLTEVVEYNKAELRLFWAMGQPVECALPSANELTLQLPALPPPIRSAEEIQAGNAIELGRKPTEPMIPTPLPTPRLRAN